MNRIIFIFLLMVPSICNATQIVYPVTYGPNSQVTNLTLNGNNSAISNVVNGNLDNSNANTTSGYRFFQTVAVLPSAGNQGTVYFLTSDNSLNFDTGSVFNKSVSINSPVNGDMLYYNSGWNRLAIGTSGLPIVSNGSIPTYASISMVNSVSGSSLSGLNLTPASANQLPATNIPVLGSANVSGLMGSWTSRSVGTIYQAATDGFVIAVETTGGGSPDSASILSDSSATPSTVRSQAGTASGGPNQIIGTLFCPVKKGDYFEVTHTGSFGSVTQGPYFISTGS